MIHVPGFASTVAEARWYSQTNFTAVLIGVLALSLKGLYAVTDHNLGPYK
jgi:hypothetical protein